MPWMVDFKSPKPRGAENTFCPRARVTSCISRSLFTAYPSLLALPVRDLIPAKKQPHQLQQTCRLMSLIFCISCIVLPQDHSLAAGPVFSVEVQSHLTDLAQTRSGTKKEGEEETRDVELQQGASSVKCELDRSEADSGDYGNRNETEKTKKNVLLYRERSTVLHCGPCG